jgi:two-component system, OmpR family, sensor kinase
VAIIKRPWLALLIVGLPLLLGGLIPLLALAFSLPIPVLVFRVDTATVVFAIGALLTLIAAGTYLGAWLRDRQARWEAQQMAAEAERSRIRFMRRLDHEIKNPLTGLQVALTNLRESQVPGERERAAVNANHAVERLSRLLTDLRKLSDLAERPAERLRVDIPQLLQEMIEAAQLQPAYGARQINLTVARVPRRLPAVMGDRDLLGLAIYNLLENALKFTSAEDAVEVRALEDGRAIIVEVADTGPGIAPEDLRSIFEELYRGTNARGIEGSGLGLALARRIVELHGGEISVRTRRAEPRGTVFTLRLPISGA